MTTAGGEQEGQAAHDFTPLRSGFCRLLTLLASSWPSASSLKRNTVSSWPSRVSLTSLRQDLPGRRLTVRLRTLTTPCTGIGSFPDRLR